MIRIARGLSVSSSLDDSIRLIKENLKRFPPNVSRQKSIFRRKKIKREDDDLSLSCLQNTKLREVKLLGVETR